MTDEQIIRKVAKIMGYEVDPESPWKGDMLWVKGQTDGVFWGFNPLTDLNQVFLVVEELDRQGWDFDFGHNYRSAEKYWAEFTKRERVDVKYRFDSVSDKPGKAISEAALKAVGEI